MSDIDDVLRFTGTTPPFDRLDDAALRALCTAGEITYHRAGSTILEQGQPNQELLLIRSGAIGLFDRTQLRDKRAERELFGYLGLLTGRPARFTVRALEDTLLYRFPEPAFLAARSSSGEFDRFFAAALLRRLHEDAAPGDDEATYGRLRVDAIMSRPARTIAAEASVREAAVLMTTHNLSSLLVVSEDGLGILTDRDLRRRLVAAGRDYATPCGALMTTDPVTVGPDETVMEAMVLMTDYNVHHLPVVADGRPVGMITASDIFRARTSQPVYFIRELHRQVSPAALADIARRRTELFTHLVALNTRPTHVGQIMTSVTDAVTVRLLELAEEALGPPPMAYAWLAFGSQARREQALRTDQDNALLLAEPAAGDAAAYFEQLAAFVCDGLDRAGFVYCPGQVMATNPSWRRDLRGWEGQFAAWIENPEPRSLMEASIFFDCRCVWGHRPLAERLLDFIFERTGGQRLFLRFMAQNALAYRPPIGFFRRFIIEHDGEHSEGLNLKRRGIVPIVAAARMRALELGLRQPGTQARLRAAVREMPGDAADLTNLAEAHELIERHRLQHQARQVRLGQPPDNFLNPQDISPLGREHLRSAFEVVRTAQQVIERRYLLG